jgi:signal transduction histidine kinase
MAPRRSHPVTSGTVETAGFESPLWRALAVFRVAALIYALVLIYHNDHVYRDPSVAWVVGAVMIAWTAVSIYAYARPEWRRWPLLVADLLVMGGCLVASVPIIGIGPLASTRSLPGIAVAGTVVAWAIAKGSQGGAIAAVAIGGTDVSIRGIVNQNTLNSAILLVLAAVAIGYVSQLNVKTQARLARAVDLEASNRTRERLAREIHDSVLQVLTLVARRAHDLGGEGVELGRLAAEQEIKLRTLIGTSALAEPAEGTVDLRSVLAPFASETVTLAMPATRIGLSTRVCDELVAAVRSALDNVGQHAGPHARAWVLVEDDSDGVLITVRDDGPGIPVGRLEEAAAAGRLGVTQSIQGRVRDLGGSTVIRGGSGMGTEVELRIPRQGSPRARA